MNFYQKAGVKMTRKGHPQSEETKRKIAEAHKGKPKGPQSEEAKRKKSEALKGRKVPLEVVEKRRQALKGQPKSEVHRQKLREANLGKTQSEESNQKRRETMLQIGSNPEYRARVSAGVRRAYENPEFREKIMDMVTSPERLAALQAGRARRIYTPEQRASLRKHMNERWENNRETMLAQTLSVQPHATRTSQEISISSLEVQVKGLLDVLGVVYEQQKPIGIYIADFFLPDRNLIIEVYGCYWHACPSCGYSYPKKNGYDKRREAYIKACGYTLFILWEHDLKNEIDINALIKRGKEF